MTRDEAQTLSVVLELVKEISQSRRDDHDDLIDRLNEFEQRFCRKFETLATEIKNIREHCVERERRVDEQIAEVGCRPSPFEISVKTVAKFVAGGLVYLGVVTSIVVAVVKLA